MRVTITFYSYFKDLAGCAQVTEQVVDGSTLADLWEQLAERFPKFAALRKSALSAVGVEYQPGSYRLKEGDQVSIFPPVQGG